MTTSFETSAHELASSYLKALGTGELTEVLELFTADAQVYSPLYGQLSATKFYTALFADTNRSQVELQDVLTHTARRSVAFLFTYHWTLTNGQIVAFDVMDYCQLDEKGRIRALRIIYDTLHTRTVWESLQ